MPCRRSRGTRGTPRGRAPACAGTVAARRRRETSSESPFGRSSLCSRCLPTLQPRMARARRAAMADGGMTIVVHGGAGRELPAERPARRAGVLRAVDAGWHVLAAGGGALDAVVAAVALLEDDPAFNAGLGSVLTESGDVEMDASVMD